MNIVMTGASGFLGKNIRNYFKDRYNIIYLSTSSGGAYLKVSKNFNDISQKLSDKKVDCIIHLAAVIPQKFCKSDFYNVFLPNAVMMDNLYKFAAEKNIKKFIYMSSFGSMRDYANYKIRDYYTLSKIHGEHVSSMMEDRGIETASLRISSPYGPYSNPGSVINIFIKNALKGSDINVYGTGKREQNFIYVYDVANAVELFLNSGSKVSGVYSIVSESNVSMLNLAIMVKDICKSESQINVGKYADGEDDYKPVYDYERAYKDVGFRPQYDIYKGLQKYIEWYVNNK